MTRDKWGEVNLFSKGFHTVLGHSFKSAFWRSCIRKGLRLQPDQHHLFIQTHIIFLLVFFCGHIADHGVDWLHHVLHLVFIDGTTVVHIVAGGWKCSRIQYDSPPTCWMPISALPLTSWHLPGPWPSDSPWSPGNHCHQDPESCKREMYFTTCLFHGSSRPAGPGSAWHLLTNLDAILIFCQNLAIKNGTPPNNTCCKHLTLVQQSDIK